MKIYYDKVNDDFIIERTNFSSSSSSFCRVSIDFQFAMFCESKKSSEEFPRQFTYSFFLLWKNSLSFNYHFFSVYFSLTESWIYKNRTWKVVNLHSKALDVSTWVFFPFLYSSLSHTARRGKLNFLSLICEHCDIDIILFYFYFYLLISSVWMLDFDNTTRHNFFDFDALS